MSVALFHAHWRGSTFLPSGRLGADQAGQLCRRTPNSASPQGKSGMIFLRIIIPLQVLDLSRVRTENRFPLFLDAL
jgi:hypothetical protein